MKKLLVMFAIAGALVACNNSSEGTTAGDSTNKMGDTSGSTITGDTSHMTTGDTSHMTTGDTSHVGDTTKK